MNRTDSLTQLLHWTQNRVGTKVAMQERFGWLLEQFEHEIDFPIIKVAGTNGKGSVSAMLAACLTEEGKKVGLFTSPHLVSPTERFRIGKDEISEQELDLLAQMIIQEVVPMVQQKGTDFTPSYFEVLTLIALLFFSKHEVEVALFEAGVGGENDAVSLLPDFCSLITSIGFDHQKQLGNTLAAIAKDKAGIARGGTLIANGRIASDLKEIIQKKSEKGNINYRESKERVSLVPESEKVRVTLPDHILDLFPTLRGNFQLQNMDLVLETYQFLIEQGIIQSWQGIRGIEKTYWPGRFEQLGTHPAWIIDAAHNELGLSELVTSLDQISKKEDRVLIYGNSLEKDFKTLLKFVPSIAPIVFLVDDFYKAVPVQVLLENLDPSIQASKIQTWTEALMEAKKSFPDRIVVVTGSIFMIGNARKWILTHGLDQ